MLAIFTEVPMLMFRNVLSFLVLPVSANKYLYKTSRNSLDIYLTNSKFMKRKRKLTRNAKKK